VLALGRWTVLFAKQWEASGLKIPLIAGGTYSDEHVLPQLGDESIGVVSAHHYSAVLDTPATSPRLAAAMTPARTKDDFPEPEAPTMATNRSSASRARTSFRTSSRNLPF
jgi:ABC-type branched-subunit amino acid transport system substrate-binding protein